MPKAIQVSKKYLIMKIQYLLLIFILISSCSKTEKTPTPTSSKLGMLSFDITGNEAAKTYFEEGLLLLHNFEYGRAADKFVLAQSADSTCAMAYWGEAMTENHPLWRQQEKDDALQILSKLGASKSDQKEKFKKPIEKDLFDAACVLYGEGTKAERDKAYSVFMEKLHKKYPENHEIAAFYALSLLGSNEGKRNATTYQKGAKIAQSIINENPNHPGALHYLIHSYDDPENAPKALFAANSYSKIAADAAHALHMPSHIFVAMGMWDEVISSNIASFNASVKRKEAEGLDNDKLGYHSYKWMNYGYLQIGDYKASKEITTQMQQYAFEKPSDKSLGHLIYIRGAYCTETEDYDEELILDTLDYSDLPVQMTAAHLYLMGNHALRNDMKDDFQFILDELEDKINSVSKEVAVGSPAMCSGSYSRRRPTRNHVDRAKVMLLELKALEAIQLNKMKTAESILKEAIALEETTDYMYGPPEIIKPSAELYGEFLMKQNRMDEAKKQFETVLERAPKRYIPLQRLIQIEI